MSEVEQFGKQCSKTGIFNVVACIDMIILLILPFNNELSVLHFTHSSVFLLFILS